MAKKPTIEPGDELKLQVDVVRVDEETVTVAITSASATTQRVTIRQDGEQIVETVKAGKQAPFRGLDRAD